MKVLILEFVSILPCMLFHIFAPGGFLFTGTVHNLLVDTYDGSIKQGVMTIQMAPMVQMRPLAQMVQNASMGEIIPMVQIVLMAQIVKVGTNVQIAWKAQMAHGANGTKGGNDTVVEMAPIRWNTWCKWMMHK